MSANLENVKATIGALLRLAKNDAATQGEIDNAIRFARRLMDAHHLTEADCRSDPDALAALLDVMVLQEQAGESNVLAVWERELGAFVQDLVGTVQVYRSQRFERKDAVRRAAAPVGVRWFLNFAGSAEDVQLAVGLYQTLHATVGAMARLRWGAALRGEGRSYCEGFVDGLFASLDAAREHDQASSEQSRALVVRATALAEARRGVASDWLEKKHGVKLRARAQRRRGEYHAFAMQEGEADGRRAQVDARRKDKLTGAMQRRIG